MLPSYENVVILLLQCNVFIVKMSPLYENVAVLLLKCNIFIVKMLPAYENFAILLLECRLTRSIYNRGRSRVQQPRRCYKNNRYENNRHNICNVNNGNCHFFPKMNTYIYMYDFLL